MKFLACISSVVLLATPAAGTESIPRDPDAWYRNHYAPLWEENTWDKVDEISSYYGETVYVHPPDGPITPVNGQEWLAEAIGGWKADGWIGSDLVDIELQEINASTVTFKTRWLDRYVDDFEEYSCGWYLADLTNGRWLFTQYAEIDCAEHGF